MLNSLYGKFGAHEYNTETHIMTGSEMLQLMKTHDVIDSEEFGDGIRELVTYNLKPVEEKCLASGSDFLELLDALDTRSRKNDYISVPIAAFVTSYGRIDINRYKLSQEKNLVYSDTDSVVTTSEIAPAHVSSRIGHMKLEYDIIEGFFVGTKLYYMLVNNHLVISKTAGVGDALKRSDFVDLADGKSVTTLKRYWNRHLVKG
jgi:hypothetical protein